jgi:hypothetical protein
MICDMMESLKTILNQLRKWEIKRKVCPCYYCGREYTCYRGEYCGYL